MTNVERLRAACAEALEINATNASTEARDLAWQALANRVLGCDPTEDTFEGLLQALVSRLKIDAAAAINPWLEGNEDLPGEAPVNPDEIRVEPAGETRELRTLWIVYVARESLEELGTGAADPSPLEALLRFIAWARALVRMTSG